MSCNLKLLERLFVFNWASPQVRVSFSSILISARSVSYLGWLDILICMFFLFILNLVGGERAPPDGDGEFF
jgi:hypothetical protein